MSGRWSGVLFFDGRKRWAEEAGFDLPGCAGPPGRAFATTRRSAVRLDLGINSTDSGLVINGSPEQRTWRVHLRSARPFEGRRPSEGDREAPRSVFGIVLVASLLLSALALVATQTGCFETIFAPHHQAVAHYLNGTLLRSLRGSVLTAWSSTA